MRNDGSSMQGNKMKTQNLWNRFRLSEDQKQDPGNLKLHFENGINADLKKQYVDLAKWLRKTYAFPTVLNVYILNTEKVRLGNGKYAYGSFKYYNKRPPRIKIPSAIENTAREEYTVEEIIEMILSSLIHEITHYYQWIERLEQTNSVSERQANFYRYRILDEFYDSSTYKESIPIFMNISGTECLGIARVLRRGSGEILENTKNALFVRDSISNAYFLACEDIAAGLELLDRRLDAGCDLLAVTDHALGKAAFERYGFSSKLECYQFAYYGEKPSVDSELVIRTAEKKDLTMLAENYSMISPEELAKVVKRGSVFIGYYRGHPVGFIGEHLEGSMGILYVFPEYRRRGFGTDLQLCLIAKTMEKGFIPFGQVEKDNEESLRLQKKIGMTRSDDLIVWMWK